MMFWNRREIFVGHSLQEFNRIRSVLKAEKIKYDYNRVKMGGFDLERRFMFYVYVHKKDVEIAQFLIRKQ